MSYFVWIETKSAILEYKQKGNVMKEIIDKIKMALEEKKDYRFIKDILADMSTDVSNSELKKLENPIRDFSEKDVNEILACIIIYC